MIFYSIPSWSYFPTPNIPLPIEGKQQGKESGLSQSIRKAVGSGHGTIMNKLKDDASCHPRTGVSVWF